MTHQNPRHPLDLVNQLHVVAAATMNKCPHCSSTNEIVRSQAPAGIGVFRLAMETQHEPDCPLNGAC